jgi:hypothetical protein
MNPHRDRRNILICFFVIPEKEWAKGIWLLLPDLLYYFLDVGILGFLRLGSEV